MIFERKRTACRLSGPPSGPGPGSSDPFPPPAPGGYGPSFYPPAYYPPAYYPPPPPPKKSNAALIIVIVVVVVVLVSVVLAAALYLLTSTLIEPPPPPMVVFGAVQETAGNATIPIASSSRELSPASLQVRLSANTSGSSRGLPPPNGSVVLIAGGRTLRVFWLDQDNDQVFGTGDAFRVTGDSAPLPYSTMFRFDLMTSSGAIISGMTWTTGPRVMGVNIAISGDGTNWTLLITSTPTRLTTLAVELTITTSANLTALGPIAFSALTSGSWSTNHAQFLGTGGTTIVVADRLLISTTTYPSGYSVQIADSQGVLYAHALG